MDGAFPLGKLGTANRDLYLQGMSMLGCQSQTLWHFCVHFSVDVASYCSLSSIESRSIIL